MKNFASIKIIQIYLKMVWLFHSTHLNKFESKINIQVTDSGDPDIYCLTALSYLKTKPNLVTLSF
jgi:hypothetical protein